MAELTAGQRSVLERGPQHMTLVVNSAGGPIGYPMTGIFDRDAVWFTTYRAARKVGHLLADGRVCCLYAPPSTDPWTEPAVVVWGVAGLSEDVSLFAQADAAVRHPSGPEVSDQIRAKVADRLASGRRVVFRVPVQRAASLPVATGGGVTWRVPT